MDSRSRASANKEKLLGRKEKERRNMKLQVSFYDEETDEAEWAKYEHIFSPAPPSPAQPAAPPAAAALAPPTPPPSPVAEEAESVGDGALQQPALPAAPGEE